MLKYCSFFCVSFWNLCVIMKAWEVCIRWIGWLPTVDCPNKQKGCEFMATKSVLKNIDIKSRKSARALVSALENAHGKSAQSVTTARTFSNADRKEIRRIGRAHV